jgi:hypothetical protein
MANPIEAKVKAATGGSTVGVALAGLILWLLDTYVFTTDPVPDPIVVAVWALLPIGLTFLGGYLAKHTPRPPAAPDPAEREDLMERLAPGHVKLTTPPTTRATGTPKVGGYPGRDEPPPG